MWVDIYWQLQETFPANLEGQELILTGYIADLPVITETSGLRLVLDVTSAQIKTTLTSFTGRVRLTWFKNAPALKAGEQWQIVAKLKARHSAFNPGGFDYETNLFRNGIVATGYVHKPKTAYRLNPANFSVLSWREGLRDRLTSKLPSNPGTGMVIALTLGDANGIGTRQWIALNHFGINHLVNVSGLHLTLIAGLVFNLVKILWQLSANLCLRVATAQAAAIGGMFLAWGYAVLAGLPVPTLRSVGMFAFLQGAIILRRVVRVTDSVVIALFMVLFFDPLAVLSPGFWLSFGAVAALIYGMSGRLHTQNLIWVWVRAQWIVFIWLFPFLVFIFNQVSIISPLINLIAIPIFSVLLPILLVAVALALTINWFWLLEILAWLLHKSLIYLVYFDNFTWINWDFPHLPIWIWWLAFPAAVLLTAPSGLPGRWVGIILILPLIWWKPATPPLGAFRLTVLDVGQGQSILIQTHDHNLVYDTGPQFFNGLDAGETTVYPALRSYGINRINTLIVSHADKDHAGGIPGLLAHITVEKVLSGEPAKIAVAGTRQCEIGQNWTWDGVKFSILYPHKPWPITPNNRSCVLHVQGQAGSVLITGDLNQTAEKSLVTMFRNQIRSEVLIAGHHGSQTSTSQILLDMVQPKWVLVSAGYRNQFKFPHHQVVTRIFKSGANIADTANGGAVEVWFDADGKIRGPISYRKIHAYPWTHQMVIADP